MHRYAHLPTHLPLLSCPPTPSYPELPNGRLLPLPLVAQMASMARAAGVDFYKWGMVLDMKDGSQQRMRGVRPPRARDHVEEMSYSARYACYTGHRRSGSRR